MDRLTELPPLGQRSAATAGTAYGQQLARTPKSGWGSTGLLAPFASSFVNPSSIADSPLFLPVLPIEPSPTTGIQHMIPPLFHGSAARVALQSRQQEILKALPEPQLPPPPRDASPPKHHGVSPAPEQPSSSRIGKPSAANHDGWQWRKYGEKIVKGSPNPRSYYKCSHQGCSAKKIVERSTTGAILSTEYKSTHCHPAPSATKTTRFRPKAKADDTPVSAMEVPPTVPRAARGPEGMMPIPHAMKAPGDVCNDQVHDEDGDDAGLHDTGLHETQAFDPPAPRGGHMQWPASDNGMRLRSRGHPTAELLVGCTSPRLDALAAYAAEVQMEADGGGASGRPPLHPPPPHGSDAKRRRVGPAHDDGPAPMPLFAASHDRGGAAGSQQQGDTSGQAPQQSSLARSQLTPLQAAAARASESGASDSQVLVVDEDDSIEDGFKWRKYGQKQVKGNPYPRSYYKCTVGGCPVRKHVERCADDSTKVVISYEGRHTHAAPLAQLGRASPGSRSDVHASDELEEEPATAHSLEETSQPSQSQMESSVGAGAALSRGSPAPDAPPARPACIPQGLPFISPLTLPQQQPSSQARHALPSSSPLLPVLPLHGTATATLPPAAKLSMPNGTQYPMGGGGLAAGSAALLSSTLALAAEAALGGGGANRASEALQLRVRQQQQKPVQR